MLNTSSSFSKIGNESQSLKKSSLESKISSKQSTEEMGSKSSEDSDRCELPVVSSAEEMNTEGKRWYEILKKKIGLDINAKEWMKKHPKLAHENKSELLIRLAYELCLAKNTEYDLENEDEEQNNKYRKFDTKRIFALFEVGNELIDLSDRKNFVEFVCQKGNVELLGMIFKQEKRDRKTSNNLDVQYGWKGVFTGYSEPIELLQYVIDNRCPQEIVLCIAEKVYGYAHIFYNGEQYIDNAQIIKAKFSYQDSVVKEFLKKAITLGYRDTVSVMLSGDIYHCIRLMKWKVFQEKQEFIEAYNMIKETVADVISSWVENKQSCKDSVQNLLGQVIEVNIKKMSKEELVELVELVMREIVELICQKGNVQLLEMICQKENIDIYSFCWKE